MKVDLKVFIFIIFLGHLFLDANCQNRWWQREVPVPSTNQIINPNYLSKKRELEQTLDKLNSMAQERNNSIRLGHTKAVKAADEMLQFLGKKMNTLEYELSKIPVYITNPKFKQNNNNQDIYYHDNTLQNQERSNRRNQDFIDLSTQSPIHNNISMKYKGAGYDYAYKNHWKIESINGYMEFTFRGQCDFLYHVLGATINGVSYCKINVYINGNLSEKNKHIDKDWHWEKIPAYMFEPGINKVGIELVGETHLWIDKALIY